MHYTFLGCPRLEAPAHGSIEYTLNIAKFTCNANHRLRGGQLSACLFGVWTPQPPTCERKLHYKIRITFSCTCVCTYLYVQLISCCCNYAQNTIYSCSFQLH